VAVLLGDIVLLAFENIRFVFRAQKNCIFTTAQISVYNCTKSFTTAQSVHNCTLKNPAAMADYNKPLKQLVAVHS